MPDPLIRTMARFQPRPPAEVRSPLSPATLEILRRLGGGRGGLLFLIGDDRIARTELLRAVAVKSEEMKLETVRLRAHPLDRVAPYGALNPWFARWFQLAQESSPRAKSGLDASFFTALAGFIETLPAPDAPKGGAQGKEGAEGHGETASVDPRPLGPEEMRAQLLALVEGRSHATPSVVTIRDAEFLDPASRDWLSFLGHRLTELPLVVVLSLDPQTPDFESWQSRFGRVTTTWERWPKDRPSRTPTAPLADQVRSLPPDSREALAAVALAGPDARSAFLGEALGWEDARLSEALTPALDAKLIEREGDALALLDPAAYPDLAGTAPKTQLATLRRAIARALERRVKVPRGPVLFRLSEHWAAVGDAERGFTTLTAAAQEADRWGSPEMAESRLMPALQLVQGEPTPRGREMEEKVYAQLARTRLRASNPAGAEDAFNRALTLARDRGEKPLEWAPYVAGLATAMTRLGQDPENLLKSTLARIEGQSAQQEATLLTSLGFYYRERGRGPLAAEVTEKACDIADRGGDAELKALAHLDAAEALFFGGGKPELERARTHLRTALSFRAEVEASREPSLVPMVLDALSHVELTLGNTKEAIRWGEDALVAARRVGSRTCLLQVLGNQAEVNLESGNLVRARDLAAELRVQCDRFGLQDLDVDRQQLLLLEGLVAAARGAFEPARQQFERLVAAAGKAGTRYYLGQALAHLVALCVQQGAYDAARQYLRQLEREGVRKTLPGVTLQHLEAAEKKLGEDRTAPPRRP